MLKLTVTLLVTLCAVVNVSSFNLFKREWVSDEGTHLKICKQLPIELGLVLDSSSSIRNSEFHKARTFIQDFVQQFDLGSGSDGARFSIITYGRGIYPEDGFNLTTYTNMDELVEAIGNIPHRAGDYTDTGKAIEYMHKYQLNEGVVRPQAEKVSIVITDGNSQEWWFTKQAAEEARADGIIIFAVGVGSGIRDQELLNIAGDPARITRVDNYDRLNEITETLAKETCIIKEKPTTTPLPESLCGEVNPSDVYFLFSPATLGTEATAWTTSFISNTIENEDMEVGFRYGVISGSCPDDEGFDLDAYDNVDDIKTRLMDYERNKETELVERLIADGFTEERGARPDTNKVAVLVTSGGKKAGELASYVEALVADGVTVFIADPTGSGVEIPGATTLFGRSARLQSEMLISHLCPQ